MRFLRRRMARLTLGTLAVVLVGAAVAYAAIPGTDGVIAGCYSSKDGTLRVIDQQQAQTCGSKETALNWNQQGPPGPTGTTGATGPAGPQGPPGPAGGGTLMT